MKKSISIIFVSLMLFCCTNKQIGLQQDENNIDTIYVTYYPYVFESNISVSCAELADISYDIPTDSIIYLSRDTFDRILQYVQSHNSTGDVNGCDCRIHIKSENYEMCLGVAGCLCDLDDNHLEEDLEVIYLIKWKSGYFNCIDKNWLIYDKSIEKYGFPNDYNHHGKNNLDDDINKIEKFSIRKIAFAPQ